MPQLFGCPASAAVLSAIMGHAPCALQFRALQIRLAKLQALMCSVERRTDDREVRDGRETNRLGRPAPRSGARSTPDHGSGCDRPAGASDDTQQTDLGPGAATADPAVRQDRQPLLTDQPGNDR